MKKLNQKGFSVIEILLVVVVVGILGFVAWFVWNQRNVGSENAKSDTSVAQDSQSGSQTTEQEVAPKTGEYDIDLSASKNPDKKEVKYSDFLVTNAGGSALAYQESTSKFVYGDLTGDGKLVESSIKDAKKHANTSDGTPVYLWIRADADTYQDQYAIDLGNGKILQITFLYIANNSDPSNPPDYSSLAAVNVQRAKDLAAVKTFKFVGGDQE